MLLNFDVQPYAARAQQSLLDKVSLNPQPLPPRDLLITPARLSDAFERVALNPQPLPPRDLLSSPAHLSNLYAEVALNPQPLPPKAAPWQPMLASIVARLATLFAGWGRS